MNCPHCDGKMLRWELPVGGNWEGEFHLVCFNDECPYYLKGWAHMEQNFKVRASYRYRVDPQTGSASPLPVWSPLAHHDAIIKEGDEPEDGQDG